MPAVTRYTDNDLAHCSAMTRDGKSDNVFVNTLGVSRKTDLNTSHKNCNDNDEHTTAIKLGSTTVTVNGLGIGRIGDIVAEGDVENCTSVSQGSPNVFAGGPP